MYGNVEDSCHTDRLKQVLRVKPSPSEVHTKINSQKSGVFLQSF